MPQDITLTAENFIAQLITPFHQDRMLLSQDAARRKPDLHFDNSRCHAVRSIIDEMAKLRCERLAHPAYSPDITLCDFYLFSCRKDTLAGFHTDADAELLQEVQGILTPINRTEVKYAFGHWIERYQSVATNKGECYPE
jgi:hypothetical protein